MRSVGILIIYLAIVFIGGALLAPWVYHLMQWAAGLFPGLNELADHPFRRYVNRCLLGLAVIGLYPLLRLSGLTSWRRVGLGSPRREWGRLGAGFGLGLATLAAAAVLTVIAGGRVWDLDHTLGEVGEHVVNAVSTAIVVSILEEVVFRGALLGILQRGLGWIMAVAGSSVVYALVHFFQEPADPETVGWASGLVTLGKMLGGFVDEQLLIPGFLSLTVAGILLGWAYWRTGTLYFSIGLHAGWIFWLKSYRFLTDSTGAEGEFWGGSKLIDGWLALIILSVTLMALIWLDLPRSGNGRMYAGDSGTRDETGKKLA